MPRQRSVKNTPFRPKRQYLLYSSVRQNGTKPQVGLPWIAYAMVPLLMADHPMTANDIAMELANQDREVCRSIYSSVYGKLRKLDEEGDIKAVGKGGTQYVATATGRRNFDYLMGFVEGKQINKMSDSVLMDRRTPVKQKAAASVKKAPSPKKTKASNITEKKGSLPQSNVLHMQIA